MLKLTEKMGNSNCGGSKVESRKYKVEWVSGSSDMKGTTATPDVIVRGNAAGFAQAIEVGSLTKIGEGKLSLTKANTYTGGTAITKGTLLVKNTTGSATGTGAVQVNTGTLGGTGIISGAVTVGTGSSSGAIPLRRQQCN